MKILVLGGTRFFGAPMVEELLRGGHEITIATRGKTPDPFGNAVQRLTLDRTSAESIKNVLAGRDFDTVIDKIAYSSNDIKVLLDVLECGQYFYMSTTAVYEPKHINTQEDEFDPHKGAFTWRGRQEASYAQTKRDAERAIYQVYPQVKTTSVRYPIVVGTDDYTERIRFYVENTVRGVPMYIDNLDAQMSFLRSDEAGKFFAFLVEQGYHGIINGASAGTVSVGEIIRYTEEKTGARAVLAPDGKNAPYNTETENSINIDRAKALGYTFTNVRDWMFELVDFYLDKI